MKTIFKVLSCILSVIGGILLGCIGITAIAVDRKYGFGYWLKSARDGFTGKKNFIEVIDEWDKAR